MSRICIVTGSRAEYGLMRKFMHLVKTDVDLELQIIATGMHLSRQHGNTYKTIEADGFEINAKVEMPIASDTNFGITRSVGTVIGGLADAFQALAPDLVVLNGDRYEAFAAGQVALFNQIPLAHVSGGELTEGAIDDCMRHCLTKMANLHFVANDVYQTRVIQLGEQPRFVFNIGDLGVEQVRNLELLSRQSVESKLNTKLEKKNILVTYHSITTDRTESIDGASAMIRVLEKHIDGMKVFITGSNSDPYGDMITKSLKDFARRFPDHVFYHDSLGQLLYLSLMKYIDVVVGNSSSGIIEAPALKKPTVNIGKRQKGRLMASSIISCGATDQAIDDAVNMALSANCDSTQLLYESDGASSERMLARIKGTDLSTLLPKRFYDLH
jgi:GDP/UDP-N,N'-diacetylbacillosamine 2-epimerase (hydrolysing)